MPERAPHLAPKVGKGGPPKPVAPMDDDTKEVIDDAFDGRHKSDEGHWDDIKEAFSQIPREQLEHAADEKLCCICMDSDKSVMFEPCRHVSTCEACSAHVNQCPLCKCVPTRKVSVYL